MFSRLEKTNPVKVTEKTPLSEALNITGSGVNARLLGTDEKYGTNSRIEDQSSQNWWRSFIIVGYGKHKC